MDNKRQKKRVIGLMLEDIYTDFSKELIKGVERALPQNRNIRLAVIAGKYQDNAPGYSTIYKSLYNSIYNLGQKCRFDGMIIHLGSFDNAKLEMINNGLLDSFGDIPKVLISSELDCCPSVNYDNEPGIREALEYLINVNGLTNICMLGGRDDNHEARIRKQIFIRCLTSNGIMFRSRMYEKTDMSVKTEAEAGRLLDRNPGVQAVFCVNDSTAVGLYSAMKKRGLVPGKDIQVFGFDNTTMSSQMKPSLSSVGTDNVNLGQRALELLLASIDGSEVHSSTVPTRLYGRGSLRYERYAYTTKEITSVDRSFIYRMFDDCFYRYNGGSDDRNAIDLRRLYYELVSRMLNAMNNRYISIEEFGEIGRLIDIFFDKGAMQYTDTDKLISSINGFQSVLNDAQAMISMRSNTFINRLFLRMKDKTAYTLSDMNIRDNRQFADSIDKFQRFQLKCMDCTAGNGGRKQVFRIIAGLGFDNAAFYMFREPAACIEGRPPALPDRVLLCCAIKNGELHLIPEDRQSCLTSEIFLRGELSSVARCFAAFPLICRNYAVGIMLLELSESVYSNGEYMAGLLGRALGEIDN